MLLLWNSQQKTMNTLNIPDDNRGVKPFLPPRTIMVLKDQGGISYVGCTGRDIALSVLNRVYKL